MQPKIKDWSKGTTAERQEAGQNARDWGTRNYLNHLRKQGRDATESEARAYINERAEICDKRRERGE